MLREKAINKTNPDKKYNIYDTLEDCVMEIEELKTELSTIVMTQTSTGAGGRDRWDTPDIKTPNTKRGRLRKDRYSALVMANMVARSMKRKDPPVEYKMIGDFAHNIITNVTQINNSPGYYGPEWFSSNIDGIIQCNR